MEYIGKLGSDLKRIFRGTGRYFFYLRCVSLILLKVCFLTSGPQWFFHTTFVQLHLGVALTSSGELASYTYWSLRSVHPYSDSGGENTFVGNHSNSRILQYLKTSKISFINFLSPYLEHKVKEKSDIFFC